MARASPRTGLCADPADVPAWPPRWGSRSHALDAIILDERAIAANRLKGGIGGVHRLQDNEVEALQQLRQAYPGSLYLFPTERSSHISVDGIDRMLKRCG